MKRTILDLFERKEATGNALTYDEISEFVDEIENEEKNKQEKAKILKKTII